jgi:2-desacetyl-2-hydroxyethyl bacteriochlorophyllide A dehydrogenase
MKSALYPGNGEIILTERSIPRIGEGEALIRVLYAGVCGSDVGVWKRQHPTATFPRIPGHEFIGILEDYKGTPPEGLKIGDTVAVQPYYSCGVCEPCKEGKSNVCRELKIMGIHMDGCFAEYAAAPLDKVYKLPSDVDVRVAALTEPLAVALHDIRISDLKPGEKVLIIGGGPIGMLLAIVARLAGAGQIAISEINAKRLQFIKEMGFTPVDPTKVDMEAYAKEATNGKGFDVVYEVSGSKQGIATMTDVAKTGATVMVIGMAAEPYAVDTVAMFFKELNLKGVRLHSPKAFADATSIVASGVINKDLEKLIDRVFPLDRIAEAMEFQISDKEHFKLLIQIGK